MFPCSPVPSRCPVMYTKWTLGYDLLQTAHEGQIGVDVRHEAELTCPHHDQRMTLISCVRRGTYVSLSPRHERSGFPRSEAPANGVSKQDQRTVRSRQVECIRFPLVSARPVMPSTS